MLLPGGVWQDQQRKRGFQFKPNTGLLAFSIAEIAEHGYSMPQTINKILQLALAELAGEVATEARISGLCIADRQFLMRELHLHFGDDEKWYSASCQQCQESFDFELDLKVLPVVEGNEDFPFVKVELNERQAIFRLPNGGDQCALAISDEADIQAKILVSCLQQDSIREDVSSFVASLTESEIAKIESAMDKVSPGIVTEITTSCSNCEQRNVVQIEPYQLLHRGYGSLLADIHRIAKAYHWTEQDILALSGGRRAFYLAMIDIDRGMSH